jgi:enoyl-CoA hydratase/carnithine racemase
LFPFQVAALLHDMVAPRIVREWCLSGEPFDVEAARAAGLINYGVAADQLDAKTDWLLNRLVDNSPVALRRGKYALRALGRMSPEARIDFAESQLPLAALSGDAQEGFAAFREKRKAHWSGT